MSLFKTQPTVLLPSTPVSAPSRGRNRLRTARPLVLWLTALWMVPFSPLVPTASHAQLTANGTFDPSKVMVAKDRVKELQSFKETIAAANEFNRTLGKPSPPGANIPGGPPGAVPPRGAPQTTPSVEAARVNSPAPSPNGPRVSARQLPSGAPAPNNPASGAPQDPGPPAVGSPSSNEGDIPDFASNNRSGGLRGFFRRSRPQTTEVSMNNTADTPPPSPRASSPSINQTDLMTELETIASRDSATPEELGQDIRRLAEIIKETQSADRFPETAYGPTITAAGIELPSNSSSPDGNSGGFGKRFGKRKKKSFDVPETVIPIITASDTGNPYTDGDFNAAPSFAPLLDGSREVRDMTDPNQLPVPEGPTEKVAPRSGPPASATNEYYVVKRDGLDFFPFMFGTETPDPEYSFDLYEGAVVKDFGTLGKKRMIQIDSGEKGIVSVDGLRSLSVSERALLQNGLASGRPWYSILDTEPEIR